MVNIPSPQAAPFEWTSIAADVFLAAAALGCIAFVILYHLLADWRSSTLGRNVMAFMGIAGLLLTLGVIRAFVQPPDHVIEVFRVLAYFVVGFIVWQRVWLLVRYQRRDHETEIRHAASDRDHDDRSREDTPERGIPAP